MSVLSENLKKARQAAGVTQSSMADFFGVTRSAVAQWESGVTAPDVSKLRDIANYLHTSVGQLFDSYEPVEAKRSIPGFWMVLGIGQGTPRYRHGSLESAQQEAQRLASQNAGVCFVVLEAVDAYGTDEPKVHQITLGEPDALTDDIPF